MSRWNMPRLIRARFVCIIGLTGAVFGNSLGCGGGVKYPNPVPVAGNATLAGEPLESGILRFVPLDGKKSLRGLAKLESGGTFVAQTHQANDGLIPGEYTVFIEPDVPTGEAKLKLSPIPDKYLSPSSPVKITINEAETDLEIEFQ